MSQNISTAVMQRRVAGTDHLDFYPTPPWATRALCAWLATRYDLATLTAWDPACGEHHMVRPLRESFAEVYASDVAPHKGGHEVVDFLWPSERRADFIITNPPFKLAEQFSLRAIEQSDHGAAMLVRSAFLESVGRYERLFTIRVDGNSLLLARMAPRRERHALRMDTAMPEEAGEGERLCVMTRWPRNVEICNMPDCGDSHAPCA